MSNHNREPWWKFCQDNSKFLSVLPTYTEFRNNNFSWRSESPIYPKLIHETLVE